MQIGIVILFALLSTAFGQEIRRPLAAFTLTNPVAKESVRILRSLRMEGAQLVSLVTDSGKADGGWSICRHGGDGRLLGCKALANIRAAQFVSQTPSQKTCLAVLVGKDARLDCFDEGFVVQSSVRMNSLPEATALSVDGIVALSRDGEMTIVSPQAPRSFSTSFSGRYSLLVPLANGGVLGLDQRNGKMWVADIARRSASAIQIVPPELRDRLDRVEAMTAQSPGLTGLIVVQAAARGAGEDILFLLSPYESAKGVPVIVVDGAGNKRNSLLLQLPPEYSKPPAHIAASSDSLYLGLTDGTVIRYPYSTRYNYTQAKGKSR